MTLVEGYFNESLPSNPNIGALSVIRLDSDAYESITDTLEALYDKLSVGGYVVVDDMHVPAVQMAVRDFRGRRGVTAPVVPVPGDYVYGCSMGRVPDLGGDELERYRHKWMGMAFLPFVAYWIKEG